MRYLSVCSGIEAATQAWAPMGWKPVAFSEIEPFPCAVLKHHYPDVPNWGDMTKFKEWPDAAVDVLCGGTPCFPGDTLIASERGLVPISNIAVGDRVLTHEGRWRRVLAAGSKFAATIRVSGQGNSAGVVTTSEHPFYSRRKVRRWVGRSNGYWISEMSPPEWLAASEMKGLFWASPAKWPVSESPVIGISGREQDVPEMTDALAWLIGRWVGDGWVKCTNRRGYVMICCGKHEADELAGRISATGLHFSRSEERTTTRFQIAYRAFALWLQENFGAGAAGKTIPTWVFGWKHRSALLDGYLSADGCRIANGWSITTVSAALGLGATLLAQSLGFSVSRRLVVTGRKDPKIEGRSVNERPFWQVRIYEHARSSIEIEGHRWGLVRKVEKYGESEVFNLEVEGDNSYVADGFVVHNCQSFSVAGLRQGLADPRGNLMLTFGAIAARYRPRWLVWENVPGVLSSNGGRDFGTFLGMLGQLGYGVAYRVLDAQHVRTRRFPHAVPQRRRRVFVVGYLGDWRRSAAVLFDRESLSGHPAPRRKAGKGTARGFECGPQGGGFTDLAPTLDARCKDGPIRNQLGAGVMCADAAPTLDASFHDKQGLDNQHINGGGAYSYVPPVVPQAMSAKWSKGSSGPAGDEIANLVAQTGGVFDVAHSLRGEGFDASEDGTGRGTPLVPVAYRTAGDGAVYEEGDCTAPLTTGTDPSASIVAYGLTTEQTPKWNENAALTLTKQSPTGGGQPQAVAFDMRGREGGAMPEGPHDTANIRAASGGSSRSYVAQPWAVRRLTPTECERLQGFPDGFTQIPWRKKPAESCPDGPRYKALGNSWAVNCADWIGERIAEVEAWPAPVPAQSVRGGVM